jgi:hypothetical protein
MSMKGGLIDSFKWGVRGRGSTLERTGVRDDVAEVCDQVMHALARTLLEGASLAALLGWQVGSAFNRKSRPPSPEGGPTAAGENRHARTDVTLRDETRSR